MLQWKIGEEMKTTTQIQSHEQLRCKIEISKTNVYYSVSIKVARQTYRWRDFCDSGNNEPNDTLMVVKCISGL